MSFEKRPRATAEIGPVDVLHPEEVVSSADFTSGLDGWVQHVPSVQPYYLAGRTTPGTLRLLESSGAAEARLPLALQVGRTYTLRLWAAALRPAHTTNNVSIGVVGIGDTAYTALPSTGASSSVPGPWTERTYTFTATAEATVLRVRAYSTGTTGNASVLIDDVQLLAHEWLEVGATIELDISEGDVTLDKGYAPFGRATVKVPLDDVALVEQLDPFADQRVKIAASVDGSWDVTPGDSGFSAADFSAEDFDVVGRQPVAVWVPSGARAFDLVMIDRRVDHADRTVDLTLATDEAILQRFAKLTDDNAPASRQSSLRSIVNYVLGQALPGAALQAAGAADRTFSLSVADRAPEVLLWRAGANAWDFLMGILNAVQLRLFCDEQRRWWLVDRTEFEVPGRLSVRVDNATEGTDTMDASGQDAPTGVIARFTWRDADDVEQTRDDKAGANGRVLVIEFDRPYPGPGTAAAILTKYAGRGRTQAVTAASEMSATPGQEISISLPGTADQLGKLQSVRWQLMDGLMELTSEGLIEVTPGSWLAQDPELDWNEVPDARTWATG